LPEEELVLDPAVPEVSAVPPLPFMGSLEPGAGGSSPADPEHAETKSPVTMLAIKRMKVSLAAMLSRLAAPCDAGLSGP
jgi:hypothetical protein